MKTNDRGIAVPGNHSPLPWKANDTNPGRLDTDAANDNEITSEKREGIRSQRDRDFMIVAANYHERMADVVRRLAEAENWPDRMMVAGSALAIAEDAAALWAEYQEAVK